MTDRTRAERQRRYRKRQKLGQHVIQVDMDNTDIERLIDAGLLNEREARVRKCIAGAIRTVVKSLDGTKNRLG